MATKAETYLKRYIKELRETA